MALFENFPYTDMHNLNLDWIIKIAKDFLDQYTHIQQLIADGEESLQNLTEDGLNQLQEKADNLENLLQEWYNTHSEDIANELAAALQSIANTLSSATTSLNTTLAQNILSFNQQAETKGAQVLASIPADYSSLGRTVETLKDKFFKTINLFDGSYNSGIPNEAVGAKYGSSVVANANYGFTKLISIENTSQTLYAIVKYTAPNNTIYIRYYDADDEFISEVSGLNYIDDAIPANAVSFACTFQIANLNQLMITLDNIPSNPIPYGVVPDYLRLDQGKITNFFPANMTAGVTSMFPLTYATTVDCTYPIPVPDDRNVYFYNNANKTFTHCYFDSDGKYISTEDSGYDSKKLTIPVNAKSIIGYYGTGVDPSKYCYVNKSTQPAYLPVFGEEKQLETKLFGKRILFVGDSIMAGSLFGGGIPSILQEVFGAVSQNNGHDGYIVCRDPNFPNDCLIDTVMNSTGTYDIVILSGGINDVSAARTMGSTPDWSYYTESNEADFAPAVFNYLQKTRNKFPEAKIFYMLTPYKNWTNSVTSARQRTFWDKIRETCDMFSIEVIDLAKNSGLVGTQVTGVSDLITSTYYLNADGTHPNYKGYKYLSAFIANEIMKQL